MLEVFNYTDVKVRVVVDENNEPWFVAKDIFDVLDLTNVSMALTSLDEDEKGISIIDTLGGNQKMTTINESGIYELIFNSIKPQAKEFRKWVTSEVMPQIRKTGEYSKPKSFEEMALETITLAKERIALLESKIEKDEPKVLFATNVSASVNSMLIGEWAKSISTETVKIGQNKAFEWLRENGYLMKNNEPYQKYIDNGYFEVVERTSATPNGTRTFKTTKITGTGQVCIAVKIYKHFEEK